MHFPHLPRSVNRQKVYLHRSDASPPQQRVVPQNDEDHEHIPENRHGHRDCLMEDHRRQVGLFMLLHSSTLLLRSRGGRLFVPVPGGAVDERQRPTARYGEVHRFQLRLNVLKRVRWLNSPEKQLFAQKGQQVQWRLRGI